MQNNIGYANKYSHCHLSLQLSNVFSIKEMLVDTSKEL